MLKFFFEICYLILLLLFIKLKYLFHHFHIFWITVFTQIVNLCHPTTKWRILAIYSTFVICNLLKFVSINLFNAFNWHSIWFENAYTHNFISLKLNPLFVCNSYLNLDNFNLNLLSYFCGIKLLILNWGIYVFLV